jgi:hypothetical protein
MDPITMMMIAQAAPAAINLIKSGVQGIQANRLSKRGRPQYQIPQAEIEALNLAKYMASNNELPGQSIMEEGIDRTTAGAIDNLKEVSSTPVDLGANIGRVYRNNLDSKNNLNISAANNEIMQDRNLIDALNRFATYQDKGWNINAYEPYLQSKNAESALRSGSFHNLSSGVSGFGQAFGTGAQARYYEDMLAKYNQPGYGNPSYSSAVGGNNSYYGGMSGSDLSSGINNAVMVDNTAPMYSEKEIQDLYRGWSTPKFNPTY